MKRKSFVLLTILVVFLTTVIVYSADAAGIPKKAISTVATFLKTDLPTTTVFTDQSNTFGAFTQIFQGTVDHQQGINNFGASKIVIRNPTSTFASTVANSAIYRNNTLTIPNILGSADTYVMLNTTQSFTANKQFGATNLLIENPTKVFATTLSGAAVTQNRTLNLPLITGTDTLGALNVASKWTANQTLQTPQINGLDINYTTYAADHTAVNTEDVIIMDASAASRALTLPTAVGNTGKEFTIVNGVLTAGNMVRILTTSSQTIDGFFSATGSLNLTNADTKITVQSDGSNWNSINSDEAGVFDYYLKGSTTRWYGSATDPTASGTILSVITTLRATPWIVPHTITIDKIQVEISTAANPTSTTCNVGIYRDNGNIYPQALVSGSDVGTFTTTAGVHTLTFGSPITLIKGLYWQAWTCGTAATTQPTFRGTPVGSIPPVLGYVSTMGANGFGTAYTVAFTYGPLPAQYPAGATILANTITPMILVEITKG